MRTTGVAMVVIVLLSIFSEPVFAVLATLMSASTINLKTGESATVTFSIINDNSFCSVTGYYSLDSKSYNSMAGYIDAKKTISVSTTVAASPKGSGSGSVQRVIYVKIVTDKSMLCGGEIYYAQLPFVINYDDSEYQQPLQAQQKLSQAVEI